MSAWSDSHRPPHKIGRRRFLQVAGSAAALGLIGSYPVFIERAVVVVSHYRIAVPHLPQPFDGLRLVHLTDLHYGPLMSLGMIERVVARANRIARDAPLCTGDYVHRRDPADIDRVWPILAQLTAPLGVYATLGNHDHWADTARSQAWLERSGQDLRHKAVSIEREGRRLWLVGAGDLWEDHRSLDALLSGIPEEDCRLVLAHNPDTADTPYAGRVDLFISGHTHGGQVGIPLVGPPVLPVRNKTYSSGLKTSSRGTGVFISRGIGWAVYPIRFNCFPEIAALELTPAK